MTATRDAAGKTRIAAELAAARARTLGLLEPVPDVDELAQHSPLMSPLVWDLAHVGHYEELWLLRKLVDAPATDPRLDDVYDAFKHPRRERPSLRILGPHEARAFLADVRGRVLDVLDGIELREDDPLTRDGFVYGMVVQHEHQHCETMLATLQLRDAPYPRDRLGVVPRCAASEDEVEVPGGEFVMGTDAEPWAYDNERPARVVGLPPYRIDQEPVTNGAYAEFVASGGYDDRRWWSDTGWAWRVEAGLEHPQFWSRDGSGGWLRARFGHREPLPPDEPVQHVCWHEADAYARWRGKRLPTEAEWEKAASRGELGATGAVWEWTATDFAGYPGFTAFPYREYSEVFFGSEYKVLRGGSWATHPAVARSTFRNWDFPIRRQIFTGFRCAGDA